MPAGEKTVLSIQSHTTHGYVGNGAARFPLQMHDFAADTINTVSLSNHSGYPVIRGHRMDLDEYNTILDGLRANNFLAGYHYVLTGYINNVDIVNSVSATVEEIRALRREKKFAEVVYYCDPVMGDEGRLYCKEEVVEAYRCALASADVTTPNYFEASVLSGITVVDLDSAMRAADWIHSKGTPIVVVKSFPIPGDASHLQFLLSCHEKETGKTRRYTGIVPYHEGRFTGTGDVFAASLVAFAHTLPMPDAVSKAMAVLQDVILETKESGKMTDASWDSRELRLTKNPSLLTNPKTQVEIKEI